MGLKTLRSISDLSSAVAHWQKSWVKLGKRLYQLAVGPLKSASFLELHSSFWQRKTLSTGSSSYRKKKTQGVNVIFKLEV